MKYLSILFPATLVLLAACSAASPDEGSPSSRGASADEATPAAQSSAKAAVGDSEARPDQASSEESVRPELYTKCGIYSCAPGWVCSDGACCKGAAMCCANAGGVWTDGHCT